MKVIPVQEAHQKRTRNDDMIDPSKLSHGLTVWLDTGERDGEGRMIRQRGYYDGPSKGCVSETDFAFLREERAEANRRRKPYDKRTMRSSRRDSFATATSFVRVPAVTEVDREADAGPRPTRSLIGYRPRVEIPSLAGGFPQGAVA